MRRWHWSIDPSAEPRRKIIWRRWPCPMFGVRSKPSRKTRLSVSEALIVCALERYRRANGEYPAALARLSPGLLENLPHDIITGETLKYRLTANGQFLLYSVGWNQRDDNGNLDKDKGDWVWPVEVRK